MAEWIAGARLLPARGPPSLEMRHTSAPLIARAGEHAPSGHWPILRERGRGDTGASLGFAVAEESKLLVTRAGRSLTSAKSAGRDLPTGDAVGRMHNRCSIGAGLDRLRKSCLKSDRSTVAAIDEADNLRDDELSDLSDPAASPLGAFRVLAVCVRPRRRLSDAQGVGVLASHPGARW